MAESFPLQTKKFAAVVDGEHTEFVLMGFTNRVMVVVTQIGAVGTVLTAKQDLTQHGLPTNSYSVQTLLGRRDEPLLETCARRLMELMQQQLCRRPLVLTLGLKSHASSTVKAILDLIVQNKVW